MSEHERNLIHLPESLKKLTLNKDLSKHLKRGHLWIFATNIQESQLPFGIYSLEYKNETLGVGIFQPNSQLRFRILFLNDIWYFKKNNLKKSLEIHCQFCIERALQIRKGFDLNKTNSFRLINGEGDGLPGLIIDIYNDTAVIKHDQPEMEKVWHHQNLARTLLKNLPQLRNVYLKRKNDTKEKGQIIYGTLPEEVIFLENSVQFSANIKDGSKTGFFLDQRDNRNLIKSFAKNASVLNLFSYTGGFSLFAAAGGASSITSVDIAASAIQAVERNFSLNGFKNKQINLAQDAFEFIQISLQNKMEYDMVITDPPSFAPNEKVKPQAISAYTKVFSDSIRLVKNNGFFAASSCSSHISHAELLEIIKESLAKTKRKASVLYCGGQPVDHPFPIGMEELRYLKFYFLRMD
ncbi:MAG: class I SAM-dependent rRNA methyltransferase [Bdellovibrionaceae bacterium]|nr:class I SAM-dependent rRNA methyltransferase [Pseudobdellovibrionaceae bacterium]